MNTKDSSQTKYVTSSKPSSVATVLASVSTPSQFSGSGITSSKLASSKSATVFTGYIDNILSGITAHDATTSYKPLVNDIITKHDYMSTSQTNSWATVSHSDANTDIDMQTFSNQSPTIENDDKTTEVFSQTTPEPTGITTHSSTDDNNVSSGYKVTSESRSDVTEVPSFTGTTSSEATSHVNEDDRTSAHNSSSPDSGLYDSDNEFASTNKMDSTHAYSMATDIHRSQPSTAKSTGTTDEQNGESFVENDQTSTLSGGYIFTTETISSNSKATPDINTNVTSDINTNTTPNINTNVTSDINTNVTPDINTNVTQNINTNVTPDINTNTTPDINTNVTPNINTNVTPDINTNVTTDINTNTTPNINTNVTPDINTNVTPDINTNTTPNINTNVTPDINTNVTPDINTNVTQNINTNVTPDINTKTTPDINTNVTPNINTNVTPDINTNVTPDINTNVTQNINTNVTPDINTKTTPDINTNVTPNINTNVTPDINTNVTTDINTNTTPNINTNVTPDINTNVTPDINTNVSQNININVTPDINTNTSPNINTNVSPDINTNVTPDINTNVTQNINTNVTPDINTNTTTNINTNVTPDINDVTIEHNNENMNALSTESTRETHHHTDTILDISTHQSVSLQDDTNAVTNGPTSTVLYTDSTDNAVEKTLLSTSQPSDENSPLNGNQYVTSESFTSAYTSDNVYDVDREHKVSTESAHHASPVTDEIILSQDPVLQDSTVSPTEYQTDDNSLVSRSSTTVSPSTESASAEPISGNTVFEIKTNYPFTEDWLNATNEIGRTSYKPIDTESTYERPSTAYPLSKDVSTNDVLNDKDNDIASTDDILMITTDETTFFPPTISKSTALNSHLLSQSSSTTNIAFETKTPPSTETPIGSTNTNTNVEDISENISKETRETTISELETTIEPVTSTSLSIFVTYPNKPNMRTMDTSGKFPLMTTDASSVVSTSNAISSTGNLQETTPSAETFYTSVNLNSVSTTSGKDQAPTSITQSYTKHLEATKASDSASIESLWTKSPNGTLNTHSVTLDSVSSYNRLGGSETPITKATSYLPSQLTKSQISSTHFGETSTTTDQNNDETTPSTVMVSSQSHSLKPQDSTSRMSTYVTNATLLHMRSYSAYQFISSSSHITSFASINGDRVVPTKSNILGSSYHTPKVTPSFDGLLFTSEQATTDSTNPFSSHILFTSQSTRPNSILDFKAPTEITKTTIKEYKSEDQSWFTLGSSYPFLWPSSADLNEWVSDTPGALDQWTTTDTALSSIPKFNVSEGSMGPVAFTTTRSLLKTDNVITGTIAASVTTTSNTGLFTDGSISVSGLLTASFTNDMGMQQASQTVTPTDGLITSFSFLALMTSESFRTRITEYSEAAIKGTASITATHPLSVDSDAPERLSVSVASDLDDSVSTETHLAAPILASTSPSMIDVRETSLTDITPTGSVAPDSLATSSFPVTGVVKPITSYLMTMTPSSPELPFTYATLTSTSSLMETTPTLTVDEIASEIPTVKSNSPSVSHSDLLTAEKFMASDIISINPTSTVFGKTMMSGPSSGVMSAITTPNLPIDGQEISSASLESETPSMTSTPLTGESHTFRMNPTTISSITSYYGVTSETMQEELRSDTTLLSSNDNWVTDGPTLTLQTATTPQTSTFSQLMTVLYLSEAASATATRNLAYSSETLESSLSETSDFTPSLVSDIAVSSDIFQAESTSGIQPKATVYTVTSETSLSETTVLTSIDSSLVHENSLTTMSYVTTKKTPNQSSTSGEPLESVTSAPSFIDDMTTFEGSRSVTNPHKSIGDTETSDLPESRTTSSTNQPLSTDGILTAERSTTANSSQTTPQLHSDDNVTIVVRTETTVSATSSSVMEFNKVTPGATHAESSSITLYETTEPAQTLITSVVRHSTTDIPVTSEDSSKTKPFTTTTSDTTSDISVGNFSTALASFTKTISITDLPSMSDTALTSNIQPESSTVSDTNPPTLAVDQESTEEYVTASDSIATTSTATSATTPSSFTEHPTTPSTSVTLTSTTLQTTTESSTSSSSRSSEVTTEDVVSTTPASLLDVDSCMLYPCIENSICIDTQSSYRCECVQGYQKQAEYCVDTDECVERPESVCPSESTCTNTEGGYTCTCNEGYQQLDQLCIDVNECLATEACPTNSDCTNTMGTFICECTEGFSMVNSVCQDVDECEESEPCPVNGVCNNMIGGFLCNCIEGYRLVVGQCKDLNECDEDMCGNNTVCLNSPGSFECACLPGYQRTSKHHCEDIDECKNDPCGVNSICQNGPGSYACACLDGFFRDEDLICRDIDECMASPCPDHSECSNTHGSFTCSCHHGYFLQEDLNACIESALFRVSVRAVTYDRVDLNLSNMTQTDVGRVVVAVTSAVNGSLNKISRVVNGINVTSLSEGSVVVNMTVYLTLDSAMDSELVYDLLTEDQDVWTLNLLDIDGVVVEDIDECSSSELNECSEFAECINRPGSYLCACLSGYLDISSGAPGRKCAMIDEDHQDSISNVAIRQDRNAYTAGSMTTMTVTMERGSHVTFYIQFGDGTDNTFVHDEILSFQYPVNVTHRFSVPGNFTFTMRLSNDVSSVSVTDVIIVQEPLHSLTLGVNHLDSLFTGDIEFLIISTKHFQNVNIVVNFGDTEVDAQFLEHLDGSFSFNHSYNIGEYFANITVFNLVSSVQLGSDISAVELITGVDVIVETNAAKPGDIVQIVVSTTTGSGIIMTIEYGNGQNDTITKQNKRGPSETVLTIEYDSPGVYLVNISLTNSESSRNELLDPIYIQNPVKMLNILVDTVTASPPGIVYLDVTHTQELYPPTAVTCETVVNDVFMNQGYLDQIHKGDYLHLEVMVDNPNITGWVVVKVNCSNMLSSQYIETGTYLQFKIENVSIAMDKDFIPVGETVGFEFWIGIGSHVQYVYVFDDEFNKTGLLASDKINNKVITDSYTFGRPGLRTILFYVRNTVSEMTVSKSIWVLQDILGLTVERYYERSTVNNLISYGHGDNEDIFPLQRPIIFKVFVRGGNNVQNEWDFGDGNITQVSSLTIHHFFREHGTFTIKVRAFNQIYSETRNLTITIYDIVLPLKLSNDGPKKAYMSMSFMLKLTYAGTQPCFIWNMGDGSSIEMFGGDNCPLDAEMYNLTYSTFELSDSSSTLTHSHVYQSEGIFDVIVITFNAVSMTSISEKALVMGISCYYPEVNFIGGRQTVDKPIKKRRSDWITLESTAFINCETSNIPIYHWSVSQVSQGQTYLEYNLDPYDTDIATVDKLQIYFMPQSLDVGLYEVAINVSMAEVPGLYTKEYTYLEISASPLIASINGGSARSVSFSKILRLDGATGSYDPDGSTGLIFEWWCRQEHERFTDSTNTVIDIPTVDEAYNMTREGGCFGTGVGQLPFTDGLIEMPTSLLEPESVNVFRLVVYESSRLATFEQTVHVVEGDPPEIHIMCIKNCKSKMNPSSELSLVSACENCHAQRSVQYLWSFYNKSGGQNTPMDLQPLIETNIDSAGIVFKPSSLVGGHTYKLRLDVKVYGHTPAFTEYTFETNLPPYGGNCSIDPQSGYALNTLFKIQCQGWVDPGEEQLQGEGLLYRFWTRVRGGSDQQLLYYGPDPFTAPSQFPLGLQEWDYIHDIVVHVSDAIGEYVETQLETKVSQTPRQNLDEVRALALESTGVLQTMKQAGQYQEYKQIIVAMASILNEEPNRSALDNDNLPTAPITSPSTPRAAGQEDVQDREKNTQLRTTIVQQLSEADHVTLDALQQTALCFKVITKQRDELSKESQATAVEAITKMTDQLTNIVDHPSRQQTSAQVILAAGEMLASVGHIVLAARIETAERLEDLNAEESNETMPDEDVNESVETEGVLNADDGNHETANLEARHLITKAINVKDKILETLAKRRAPGQDLYLQTEAFTVHAKREELTKIDKAVLESESGTFVLPPTDVIFSNDSSSSQIIDINLVAYPVNPYVWSPSAKFVSSVVVSLEMMDSNGHQLNITNLTAPIQIDIKLDSSLVDYQTVQATLPSRADFQQHAFKVRSNTSNVHIIIKPQNLSVDDTFEMFISCGHSVTEKDYVIKEILPHNASYMEEIATSLNGTLDLEKIEDELKYTVILPVDVIQQYGTGWWYVGVRQLVNETDEAYYQDYDDLGLYYDNDLETTMVTFNYSIGFMTAGCYFWETVDELWTTTGCQVSALSSSYFTRCHCNHLTSFGADFFVPPNSIQFETVFANMGDELNDNYAVLATLVGIFLLYFIGLVWARHQDKRDVKKWGVLPLTDNITTDSYFYEITVCTGMRHAAGTRSKIYFILAGDHGDTGIRQLKDDKDVKQFSRGSINKFILSVEQPLGPLSYLRIWHDSSGIGKSQGWYLSKIIVQDLQQEQISVFLCNQWLALEEDDGMTDRLLPVANREDLTRFSNLFLSNTRKNLTDSHLWISIFSRPNWSNFSRVQRLSCLFALIMTSMLSSAMFYKADAKIERAQGYTIGPLKFTLQELYISIVSNLIVLPVSLVIVQLFRRSKPKKTVKENAFNIERPMSALSRIGLTFSHFLRKRTIVTPIASEDGSVHGRRDSTYTLRRHNDQTQPVSPERITAAHKGQQTTTSSDQSSIPSVVTPVSFKFAETPAPAVFAGTSSEPPSPGYYDARHHHSPAPPLCLKANDAVHKTVKYADKLVEYDETDERRERQQNANEPLFKRINRSSLKSPKVNKPQLTILANKSKSTEFLARCEASLDLTPNDQNLLSISPNRSPNLTPTISPGYESAKSPSGISAFSFDSSHSRHSSVSLTQEEMEDITIPRHANHTAAAKGKITLPHWCVYIAWFLVFLSASVSAFLTFMYSMEWGKQKSLAWLASMILSIVESVSIVQPVKILLLAMFVAAIVRKPEEELEKEEENKVLYQIQPDEICTVHPSGKTSRNNSQMEPPDTVRLKKAREKRLKEMKMFRIIQEIVFYMFYLMILILVASHNRDSKSYQVKQVLMNLLSPKHNLSRINETKHVWDWIDDCLVPGLYPTEHWSNGSSDAEGGRLIVTEAAYRLGPVRLRQHRVKPDLCIRADEVLSYINKCSFDINQDHDSSWDYSVAWKPLSSNNSLLPGYTGPWLYRSSKETEGLPFVGEIGSYSGGGYVADLIGQKSHVADILVFLRNNNWLDAYTRILFVEFTVYNPNINLFTMSQVVLEMSTTGVILTNVNFFTFRLFTYLGAYGIFMILCELLAFACVIYFIGLELKQIKRDGKGHFRSFWNILQLCTLLASVVCVMMYLLRHAMTSMAVERITKLRDRFYNFQRIAAWDDVFQTLLAISIFFSILKVIHLLRFNRRMSLLARTLKQAGGEMAAFSLVLFIFLLAFVCCGHLLFGANVHGFSNMIRGFETLMAFSLGSYDFTYLTKSNRTLGPVFFFVYFTFVVFVLVNMFVTILNEAVTVVHYDVARQRNEYELLDFLLGRLKTWLRIDLRKTILDVKKKYMPGLLSCEESIDADMKDIEAKLDRISGKLDFMLTNDHHTVTDFDQLFLDEAHREELGYENSRSNWSTY